MHNKMNKKALIVVDMQEVCVGKNHAECFQYPDSLLPTVNQIIDANKGNIVIYIRNIMKKNTINKFAPFQAYEGSKEIELVEGLHIISNNIFDKYTGDAFSNKELPDFLKKNEVEEVEIIGVDGGGCVPLTALGALKNGYKVVVNTKGIGTMFTKKHDSFFRKLEKKGATIL